MEEKMNWAVADTVDYNGGPADRTKTGGWLPAFMILGAEISERLSTMGIVVNLVTYLTGTMHLPSAEAANTVTNFMGTCFLLSLLGGFVADTFLGRFKTLLIFASLQTLGTLTLAISTNLPQLHPKPCEMRLAHLCKRADGFQMGILYLALYLTALGTGGVKSSVSGFGSDQFDENDPKEKARMSYFFNRFFFIISTGSLLAVTVLVYIQDNVGRSWAYGICSVSMSIAIVILISGAKQYRYKKCAGSPLVQIFQVIFAAIKKRNTPFAAQLLYRDSSEASMIPNTDQFRCLNKAAVVVEGDFETYGDGPAAPNPWKLCSVTKVEEVKMVIKLLPIWATTIMFWTTYAQILTFSIVQAVTMERTILRFQIPAGSLTAFFVIAILITLGAYDRLIMPLWMKYKGQLGFTSLQKIGIGLVLSTLGMAAAAVTEMKRLSVAKSHTKAPPTLPITVFYLIPQFFLVGSGQGFIYTGQLDFFITQSPRGMKTMSTGLFLTTPALGFFFSSLLVSVVKKVTGGNGRSNHNQGWMADNINYGRLDCFYGLLTVLSCINFAIYLVCAVWYQPQKPGVSNHDSSCVVDDSCC